MSDDEALEAILNEVKATREATEKTANNVLQFGQELHEFRNDVQKLKWRVEKLEHVRLPFRFPWLALLLSVLSLVAVMLLAWRVLQ